MGYALIGTGLVGVILVLVWQVRLSRARAEQAERQRDELAGKLDTTTAELADVKARKVEGAEACRRDVAALQELLAQSKDPELARERLNQLGAVIDVLAE